MISFGPTVENPYFDNIHMPLLKDNEYITFKHNDDPECAKDLEVPYPSMTFIRKFEQQIVSYNGEADMQKFTEWWFKYKTPTVFKLEDYQDVVFKDVAPFLIVFREERDKDEDFMAEYEESARENENSMYYAY